MASSRAVEEVGSERQAPANGWAIVGVSAHAPVGSRFIFSDAREHDLIAVRKFSYQRQTAPMASTVFLRVDNRRSDLLSSLEIPS